jgi:hypothetical protein
VFETLRVSYDDLMNDGGSSVLTAIINELSDVALISITNMPESFGLAKKDTLAWMHPCAIKSGVTNLPSHHCFPYHFWRYPTDETWKHRCL